MRYVGAPCNWNDERHFEGNNRRHRQSRKRLSQTLAQWHQWDQLPQTVDLSVSVGEDCSAVGCHYSW